MGPSDYIVSDLVVLMLGLWLLLGCDNIKSYLGGTCAMFINIPTGMGKLVGGMLPCLSGPM